MIGPHADSKALDPPHPDLHFDKIGVVGFDSHSRLLISLVIFSQLSHSDFQSVGNV
jgi:hypothetical protein